MEEKKELSLVETVQQQILNYVTKDGYEDNRVLPKENELAETLGVSRVVVREALSRLRALGFIKTKRKKGTVLTSPKLFGVLEIIINSGALNENAVKDLYELRLMLEIGMADFIFERKEETSMNRLLQLIEEEEACKDPQRLVELDIEFHSVLYNMANSKSLSHFQNLIGKIFAIYPKQSMTQRKPEIITHRGLYKILKDGNPDSFRSAMRLHLTYQFENKDNYLKTYYEKTANTSQE